MLTDLGTDRQLITGKYSIPLFRKIIIRTHHFMAKVIKHLLLSVKYRTKINEHRN